ncbi:leucine efflux protein [Actinorhabdospora filicis]|uniref:Leucine efflux protein n=1 Tax=Actinorhabdospora filicis TaxID=1785913 RepID=A0A9W6SN69_9ACTN|nr:leucine efflux protein LeuE [Actinorhabdospora filicis]GLZ79063.1 leucine efflux protein [Actinorhabdospora filicis]
MGVTNIWAYLIGTLLIILLPGPNSLYVLSVAARRGVRDGYRAAAGVFIGDSVLMVLSAAGAASLLKASPTLFNIVRWAGVAYLCWIGFNLVREAIQIWRTRKQAGEATPDVPAAASTRVERPFYRALGASLLNPKAILFFVSFFVQFVDPEYAYPALTFLILGAIVQVFSLSYLTLLIFSGSGLANAFRRRRRLASAGSATVGAVVIGFAAKLAVTSMG